jgi:Putative zinc-finger
MTGDIHLLLGSYVLGGLSAEDRRAFDEHLENCARCKTELAEAAPLPALLRKVPGIPAMPIAPVALQPSLSTLLASVQVRRKREIAYRWVALAAAVVVAFGAGVSVITVTHRNDAAAIAEQTEQQEIADEADEGQLVVLQASAGHAASGEIGLKEKLWGTSIWLKLTDMPRTGVYTLWATDDQGHRELAATWAATPSGRCVLDGATSIATTRLRKVSVVGPDEAVVAAAAI